MSEPRRWMDYGTSGVMPPVEVVAAADYDALRARVADLSMLVRRLSRYAPPGLAGDALDYLKRHGLEGSPMRDAGNKTEPRK